jgi:hypothetical protein
MTLAEANQIVVIVYLGSSWKPYIYDVGFQKHIQSTGRPDGIH